LKSCPLKSNWIEKWFNYCTQYFNYCFLADLYDWFEDESRCSWNLFRTVNKFRQLYTKNNTIIIVGFLKILFHSILFHFISYIDDRDSSTIGETIYQHRAVRRWVLVNSNVRHSYGRNFLFRKCNTFKGNTNRRATQWQYRLSLRMFCVFSFKLRFYCLETVPLITYSLLFVYSFSFVLLVRPFLKTEVSCRSRCLHIDEPSLLKAIRVRHALSPVMATGIR
jgi:hypothetical protein